MSHRPRSPADCVEAPSASSAPPRFSERLWAEAEAKQSWVCLGLDVVLKQLPHNIPHTIEGAQVFLRNIVDASIDDVAVFKPNLAFYLALGSDGIRLLTDIIEHIDRRAIVILDGKFGDVPDTVEQYARAAFDVLGADAVTVDLYGGWGTLKPMLADPTRGVFVWTRSSNPGADAVQGESGDSASLFRRVAREIHARAERGNLGSVVGATRPDDVRRVRAAAPDVPILAPGLVRRAAIWRQWCEPASATRLPGCCSMPGAPRCGRQPTLTMPLRRVPPCARCATASTRCG